jgi:hypothetical protein
MNRETEQDCDALQVLLDPSVEEIIGWQSLYGPVHVEALLQPRLYT